MTGSEEKRSNELEVVQELKRRTIKDATPGMLKDESVFYRFAKARDFNLKNAETMIRNHIAWRKEHSVDTIVEDYTPPTVLSKYFTISFICYDKDGCPVRYVDMGKLDLKGVISSCKPIDFIKYNIYLVEQDVIRLEEQSKKLGKPVNKIVYIYNFDKISFIKASYKKGIEWMMFGIKMYQDNYPERIKSLYMTNASFYYNLMFNIMKVVVASSIIDKITLFGENGWKEALLNQVHSDDLPAFLGGNRTDPDGDPLCKSFIIHGANVPDHFYLTKSDKSLSKMADVKKITVNRFSKTDLTFEVYYPDSLLEWVFETRSRDIGFGVYFQGKSKLDELVPKQRIDTDFDAEMGVYKCDRSGTYVLVFDNSYSWVFQKEIFYKVRIIPPSDCIEQNPF